MKLLVTISFIAVAATGCFSGPVKLVAPVDAYACIPSQHPCRQNPIPETWSPLIRPSLHELTGSDEVSLPILHRPYSAETVRKAKSLPSGVGMVCPTLRKVIPVEGDALKNEGQSELHKALAIDRAGACVNYYSPLLVSQLVEDLKRLNFAMDNCERVAQAIGRQRTILDIEDKIADPDIAVDLTMASLSRKDMERLSFPKAQIDEYYENKEAIINGKDQIRSEMRAQILDYDYANRLADAILSVDLAQMSVERQLFLIKEVSVAQCGDKDRLKPLVRSNDWVTKGTEVLEVRSRLP